MRQEQIKFPFFLFFILQIRSPSINNNSTQLALTCIDKTRFLLRMNASIRCGKSFAATPYSWFFCTVYDYSFGLWTPPFPDTASACYRFPTPRDMYFGSSI